MATDFEDDWAKLRSSCRAGDLDNCESKPNFELKKFIKIRHPKSGFTMVHSVALFHRANVLEFLLKNGAHPGVAGYDDGQ